ncbi:MAG TPA: amylo-alpha-1,6-glucosidase [Vicinamibacterales bacterium]|nr:amylo-alpha-1,6-glucosidase [Vicinamibacterales bacterium]
MLDEQFPIIAGPERPAVPLSVLKHGDCFGVFDPRGNIVPGDASEEGIYYDGTRFLSRFELLLFGNRPLLLSSTVSVDDAVFDADLTNPDVLRDGHIAIERGEVNVHRSRVLWETACVERIRVTNFRLNRIDVPLAIRFDADFADVFEVRGTQRAKKGQRLPDQNGDDYLMCYRGLDERERRSRVRWSRNPDKVDAGRAAFLLRLEPKESATIVISVSYETDAVAPPSPAPVEKAFDHALSSTRARRVSQAAASGRVLSSSAMFNRWLVRSSADLHIMLTDTPHGSYPYAGIPWFSTPFGRDGLITAFELLWVNPGIARCVLSFLADTQATSHDDAQDAQPGKILHEMRGGEMAALGEVPFGRYYGSVDSTPLFVMLAYAYYERTGDREFIDRIWPNIGAALEWMMTSGDPDEDGFLDYARKTDAGLLNQGWKDSHDSIFHSDGRTADGPIALCEVQGYAYAAWKGAASLATLRGDGRRAEEWTERAEHLRERFELTYWCEDLGTYALALDGSRRPCRVRTSNPGHCLFAGLVMPDRAKRVSDTLMSDASFNGWGVRTVAASERRYNPQSYHNGSIWPHDNAIIAAGVSRYGFTDAATKILSATLELSEAVDLHRLPELICGFTRRGREPTLYPVACAPQAWAAGAVYLMLAASLGIHIDAPARRISFSRGRLPESIDWLRLTDLKVGDASVDLQLERHPHDLGVTIIRREGDVEIVTVK